MVLRMAVLCTGGPTGKKLVNRGSGVHVLSTTASTTNAKVISWGFQASHLDSSRVYFDSSAFSQALNTRTPTGYFAVSLIGRRILSCMYTQLSHCKRLITSLLFKLATACTMQNTYVQQCEYFGRRILSCMYSAFSLQTTNNLIIRWSPC